MKKERERERERERGREREKRTSGVGWSCNPEMRHGSALDVRSENMSKHGTLSYVHITTCPVKCVSFLCLLYFLNYRSIQYQMQQQQKQLMGHRICIDGKSF